MTTVTSEPNHHRHPPGFAGASGAVAALSMAAGRGRDARLAARLTAVGPGDDVIAVGCGPGAAARHARSLGATVTAVDPAAVMLRTARLLTVGRRGIRYVIGTAEQLPVDGGSAAVLWSIATVHHWADIDRGLAEARRALRTGGRLLASERQAAPEARGLASHGWTEAQAHAFADRARTHGFLDIRVDEHAVGRRRTRSVLAVAP